MSKVLIVGALLMASASSPSLAAIEVRILDAPPEVFSYEPIFVAFELLNTGSEAVLVPEYGCWGQGAVLEVGLQGESLADLCAISDFQVTQYAWIAPGRRRLYLKHLALGAEGLFEVQAVVRNSGVCRGSLVGSDRRPLSKVRDVDGRESGFECWEGEAKSQPMLVQVRVPSDAIDVAAAEFLKIERAGNWKAALMLAAADLRERFPGSHYMYAAYYAGGGAYGALAGVKGQPGNALNRWAVAAAAAAVAGRTRKCAPKGPEPFLNADDAARQIQEALAAFPPSRAASDYLEQLAADHAAEDCAKGDGGSTGGGGQGGGTKPASESGASSRRPRRQASNEGWGAASSGATARSVEGAFPSTMGFKKRLILSATPGPSIHWLSLPYRYEPEDVGTIGVVDAEDLCQDVGVGGGVTTVLRWDEPTSTIVEHACGNPSPFALQAGQAYGIRRTPNWSLSANLAGGHDDALSFSIPASGTSQLSWVSVPYHLRNATNNDPVTAEGLCQQIGTSELSAIVRYDPAAGAYRAYGCGSTFESPFQVDTVEGLGLVNLGSQTISWQPLHY